MVEIRDVMRKSELFADLPVSMLDRVAEAAHYRVFERGELAFYQGDVAHSWLVVGSGRMRLVQHTVDGKEVTVAIFVPGDPVGIVVAIMGEEYPGSAEALETSEIIILPGELLWQLIHEHAALGVRILKIVSARLHDAYNQIRELSAERVQRRIARSMLRLADKVGIKESGGVIRLDIPLSRQDLAQMNGTTLETVSRTLAAWERSGIVSAGREHVTILKQDDLVTIAEDLFPARSA